MPFPADYLKDEGTDLRVGIPDGAGVRRIETFGDVREWLSLKGLVATRQCEPFPGQVARVQIDVYGESAAEVEASLLEYAQRCDAASQASSVAYGRCVIERNLEEEWGATYSWRGRLALHPVIGTIASSERAAAAVADEGDRG